MPFDNERREPNSWLEASLNDLLRKLFQAIREFLVELQPAANILLEAIVDLKNIKRQFLLVLLDGLQVLPQNFRSNFLKIVIPGAPAYSSLYSLPDPVFLRYSLEVNRERLRVTGIEKLPGKPVALKGLTRCQFNLVAICPYLEIWLRVQGRGEGAKLLFLGEETANQTSRCIVVKQSGEHIG